MLNKKLLKLLQVANESAKVSKRHRRDCYDVFLNTSALIEKLVDGGVGVIDNEPRFLHMVLKNACVYGDFAIIKFLVENFYNFVEIFIYNRENSVISWICRESFNRQQRIDIIKYLLEKYSKYTVIGDCLSLLSDIYTETIFNCIIRNRRLQLDGVNTDDIMERHEFILKHFLNFNIYCYCGK